jgi:SAM-dependent methyltransferase
MLELDRQMAVAKKFDVRLFQASMTSMPMLRDGEFDLVIHPVSTCYVQDIQPMFREVARVLKPGGLYVSQHKQPMNLQCSLEPRAGHYVVEHPPSSSQSVTPSVGPSRLREPGTREFAHSLESLVGGICRAGMVIEDLVEPRHGKPDQAMGSFAHRCLYIPPYIRIKARRPASSARILDLIR